MKIEKIPLGQLTPDPDNAKEHTPKQIAQIKASIERFGNNDPIAVWGKDNLIVEGNGRYEALKALGYKEAEIIRLDRLTDEERRAYALAHNQLTMNTGWLDGVLEKNLDAIESIDMDDFGFDVTDYETPAEIVEDEAPEIDEQKEPTAKRGDIWKLGDHRLMCGDSANADDVALLMGGGQADMVFTDPPYGVAVGSKNALLNSVQKAGRCCDDIENDTLEEAELYELLKRAFENVKNACAEDAVYYVTSPQGGSLGLMMMMMKDAGLPVRHVLMWEKSSATFSLGRLDYDYQHEPIFYTWGKKHHNFRKGECRTTVWKFNKPRKCDLHPTMKPIELVVNAILDGSEKGMNVLDVFGGSGTTMMACEQTGRKCYMMELDPRYCDVIIQRWENFTGRKAELPEG